MHLSLLNATAEQLRGQPLALVIAAENDVLRDEGEACAHKLTEAGARMVVTRCNTTIHDSVLLNVPTIPAAEASGFPRETFGAR